MPVIAHAETEQPASGAAAHLPKTRGLFITAVREQHGTPVQLQPVQLLPSIAGACVGRAGWLLFSYYWVVALYQGAYVAFPASEGGSYLLTRLLVAYTHQAILVLLPMHPQNCTQDA